MCLQCSYIGDVGFYHIGNLKGLEELQFYLYKDGVSDCKREEMGCAWKYFARLTRLRRLEAAYGFTPIKDEEVKFLTGMSDSEELN